MIDILVGSQMGTAEYVAEQVAESLVQAGYEIQLHLTPDVNYLNRKNFWLVVTSTYGAGDLPDNIQPFADRLAQDPPDLTTLSYAVITLGDSSYDTFCLAGKKIADLLNHCQAKALLPPLEIDVLASELPEDQAVSWIPDLINLLV